MVTETRQQPVVLDLPQYSPVALKLWEAREWLSDESHWGKKDCGEALGFPSKGGRSCAMLALGNQGEAYAAADYLYRVIGGQASAIWAYNDAPSTTHADILNLFTRAIDLALAEGK